MTDTQFEQLMDLLNEINDKLQKVTANRTESGVFGLSDIHSKLDEVTDAVGDVKRSVDQVKSAVSDLER